MNNQIDSPSDRVKLIAREKFPHGKYSDFWNVWWGGGILRRDAAEKELVALRKLHKQYDFGLRLIHKD